MASLLHCSMANCLALSRMRCRRRYSPAASSTSMGSSKASWSPWSDRSSSAKSSPGMRHICPKTSCDGENPPLFNQLFFVAVSELRSSSRSSKDWITLLPLWISRSRRFFSQPPCRSALPFSQGASGWITCCRMPMFSRLLSKWPLNSLPASQMISCGAP